MTEHNFFSHPYASFTNAQLPLLKVVARSSAWLVLPDTVGVSGATMVAECIRLGTHHVVTEQGHHTEGDTLESKGLAN